MSKFITGFAAGIISSISLLNYYSSKKRQADSNKRLQHLITEYRILSAIEKERSGLSLRD